MYALVTNHVNWHMEKQKTQGISKYNLSGYPAIGSHVIKHDKNIKYATNMIITKRCASLQGDLGSYNY